MRKKSLKQKRKEETSNGPTREGVFFARSSGPHIGGDSEKKPTEQPERPKRGFQPPQHKRGDDVTKGGKGHCGKKRLPGKHKTTIG